LKTKIILSILFGITLASNTPLASEESDDEHYHHSLYNGKNLVLNAKGEAAAYPCQIPPTDRGTTDALCFNIPLYNLKNGQIVGTLKDALTDFRINEAFPSGIIATVRSHFQFHDDDEHQLLVTGVIGSVQPFLEASTSMTHLTGFIPNKGDNNVLDGTGRFQDRSGTVRESGAVNLSKFTGKGGDVIGFDLIWVINFD